MGSRLARKKLAETTIYSDLMDKVGGIQEDSLSQLDRRAAPRRRATKRTDGRAK